MPTPVAYAEWKAPKDDGWVVVWPAPDDLLSQTRRNLVELNSSLARILDVPLPEIRRQLRQWLGHHDINQPIIGTGHQTELYHPGVWIKNALINALAEKTSGIAYHIAVDTDSPKHLRLRWPGGGEALTDDPNERSAEWSGLVDPPTPAHLKAIETEALNAAKSWPEETILPEFFDELRARLIEQPNISAALASVFHAIDWKLGMKHHTMLASSLWDSEAFALLLAHVASRAPEFARDYNAALAEYRKEQGITTSMRPMPDLRITDETIEIPFWMDDLASGRRERATVRSSPDGWQLEVFNGDGFTFTKQITGWAGAQALSRWLRERQTRLSPRALTLTMFLRLCLFDQFVHGIGGGRYDQVLDRLIQKHFQVPAPNFCVTTATLYFPGSIGRTRACLPCIKQEGHQLKHRLLGTEKLQSVTAIAELPRRSAERFMAFTGLRRKLADLEKTDPSMAKWRSKLSQAVEQSKEDAVLFDRELFYCMQPKSRLIQLIDRVRETIGR